jgi:hypothetical protein
MRARWKVLGLAYVKLRTSGCWVGNRTGAGVTASNSWLRAWIGLEINLFSFIPIISNNKNIFHTTSMIKLLQSMGIGSSIWARWKVLGLAYNWCETWENCPLSRDPDRCWCHHHTSVKLCWSQPMVPWTEQQYTSMLPPFHGALGCNQKSLH